QVLIPILAGVIPIAFEVGVVNEITDTAYRSLWRAFRGRYLAVTANLLCRRQKTVHQAALIGTGDPVWSDGVGFGWAGLDGFLEPLLRQPAFLNCLLQLGSSEIPGASA